MIEVFTLVIILLAGGGVGSYTRDFKTEQECQSGALAAHEAAQRAIGIIDLGTVCVKSTFDPNRKPRA